MLVEPSHIIGRYAVFDAISAGGMATVYYGRLLGPVGFARTVAIKKLHPQYSRDPDFVSMFVDEARLAAKVRHPNVVPVLDVVQQGRELYLVMEYVLGATLAELVKSTRQRGRRIPPEMVLGIIGGCLEGLHAAHETRDERGALLGIVHRDVSPANLLVGRDGLTRVLDFGIAKAAGRAQITRHGELKGKLGYMAPEQLKSGDVGREADVFAVAVTLWEALTSRRAYVGEHDELLRTRRRPEPLALPSSIDASLAPFDDVVLRGAALAPTERFPSARAMAEALSRCAAPAGMADVSAWLEAEAGDVLDARARVVASLEAGASPTEVRAAIREQMALDDDPSISVSTWSDPSIDVAALMAIDGSAPREPTTRELVTRTDLGTSTQDAPTSVEPALERAEQNESQDETAVKPPAPPPSWGAAADFAKGEPSARPSAPPVWAEPDGRGASRTRVWMLAGALSLVVGGAAAFVVLGKDVEPSEAPATAAASGGPSTRGGDGATISEGDRRPNRLPAPAATSMSGAPPVSAAPGVSATRTRPRGARDRGPRHEPSAAGTGDPFDALGGRH